MEPLPLGEIGATPWSFSPVGFVLIAVAAPCIAWLACAWKRAFEADPNQLRRLGIKEMRRLLTSVRKSRTSPSARHLHAWLRATAKTWDVPVSAPTAAEVSQSLHAITGDTALTSKWRDLWFATERALFAASTTPPHDWLECASSAAAAVEMPRRARRFPNRLRDWLPSVTAMVLVCGACSVPGSAAADLPAQPVEMSAALRNAQEPALKALGADWNDWAAHHNIAAYEAQEGDWNMAVAHATAAFLQHPSSTPIRNNLRMIIEQAGTGDPNLRRLLSGTWYERMPALLSSASWQHVALAAATLLAAALTVMVLALYMSNSTSGRRYLLWAGRAGAVAGGVLLATAIGSWNAYGMLNQPTAAIVVWGANLSPVPTDLVPQEETSPIAAGTVVLTRRSFLGWQQIAINEDVSGWVRRNAVMPIYADRT
jgi:hypothetical protein